MRQRASHFQRAAEILLKQAEFGSRIWMKSVADRGVGNDVIHLVKDIRRFEKTSRKRDTTWADKKDKTDKRRMRNTMTMTCDLNYGVIFSLLVMHRKNYLFIYVYIK